MKKAVAAAAIALVALAGGSAATAGPLVRPRNGGTAGCIWMEVPGWSLCLPTHLTDLTRRS